MERIDIGNETWMEVAGYEGLYEVSSEGRIWSVRRNKYLSACNCNGYRVVSLRKEGVTKMMYVHRVVLQTFNPTDDSNLEVNHKNEDRADNRLENLEWMTHCANVNYGTCISRGIATRARNGNCNPDHIGMDHHEQMRRWQVENRERYELYQKAYNAGRRSARRAERRRRDEQQRRA